MLLKKPSPLFLIHILTALGAPLALLALIAGAEKNLPLMLFWLWVALIVDGLDGPLARKYNVKDKLPRWDGVILDLVIDYATYVFLPAFALYQSGLLSPLWSIICGVVIVFSGAIYFADNNMKTANGGFSGFPGVWNMVIVVLIALQSSPVWILFMVALCTALTFLPVHFVHPVRTVRWRSLTLGILAIWCISLAYTLSVDFLVPTFVTIFIIVTSIYLFIAGAVQQLLDRWLK
ncbi:CDP-alcohol phosphatidyltransferase family protein [Flexibacterium corallicola]|uniref:CDP-alcohol phosphatidyltransferase family protein n=1 Tax=Flexibacterium corallicola TaxID=3037259 RepID=UPI00286ECF7E|nr:CDP-alcohol phosphatidyltransferase family protein [Pseudovibrio sp. M1P-2-3]